MWIRWCHRRTSSSCGCSELARSRKTPSAGSLEMGIESICRCGIGKVESARNLSGFDGSVPLASLLARALGVPVFLGNDVGVALDAEAKLGAGAGARSFVGCWWGTGIGGGVVIDGKRWLGRGAAGEIGHTVVRFNGAVCPCGRRGCLEAYAGRHAMELRAQRLVERGVKT